MKIIKRQMTTPVEQIVIGNDNIDTYLPYCQASFNSDGNVTLRNYDRSNKNIDEIIILSQSETKALFDFFSKMGQMCNNYNLPF